MKFSVDFIVTATQGQLTSQTKDHFSGYTSDNRDAEIAGKIFIALKGEAHDGHQFVSSAVAQGAAGVLYSQWNEEWQPLLSQATFIAVEDTLVALQQWATAWRKKLTTKIIGITGSNGKTTTKDFLAQILSPYAPTHCNKGSFNNHWGLPFTLLDTEVSHRYCVTEMGMNHAGELAQLSHIALPDIVTVVNVGRAHMGNFSDGAIGVAKAKEEIYTAAPDSAAFVFNVDQPQTRAMRDRHWRPGSLTYSTVNPQADVLLAARDRDGGALKVKGHIRGQTVATSLAFWGEQNIENLSAACALALSAGLTPQQIVEQIPHCHTGWGRNQWVSTTSEARILFDAYNANPDSFAQLITNLKNSWNDRLQYHGIFGEMRELGDAAAHEHGELGKMLGQFPWRSCLFIGPSGASFRQGFERAKNQIKPVILNSYEDSLDLDLTPMLNGDSLIIIKGSRGSALERFVMRMNPVHFTEKK